jgi:hypothetical protein
MHVSPGVNSDPLLPIACHSHTIPLMLDNDTRARFAIDWQGPAVTDYAPDGTTVTYRLAAHAGRPVVSEVFVRRPQGLHARSFRAVSPPLALHVFSEQLRAALAVPLDDPRRRGMQAVARALVATDGWQAVVDHFTGDMAAYQAAVDAVKASPAGTPRRDRIVRLARMAAAYVDACEGRRERRPNEVVAAQFGVKPEQVRDALYAARHARPQLLTEAPARGVPGGGLTREAVEILRSVHYDRHSGTVHR